MLIPRPMIQPMEAEDLDQHMTQNMGREICKFRSQGHDTRTSEARRAYAPARLFDFRSKTGSVVWRRCLAPLTKSTAVQLQFLKRKGKEKERKGKEKVL